MDKKLSFVVCSYNRSELLSECMDILIEQIGNSVHRENYGLIIVDNNSQDDTGEMVKRKMADNPFITYVKETVQGLSAARNKGAAEASSGYVCYVDDDARPMEGFADNVYSVIVEHEPDIVGGPIFPFYKSPKPGWFRDAMEIRKHSEVTGFSDCLISGSNFTVKSSIVKELGGFNNSLGMRGGKIGLGDEREFLERYRTSRGADGIRIYYSLDCAVQHLVPACKMTIKYYLLRAFMSGRMKIAVRNMNFQSPPLQRKHSGKKMTLKRILFGGGDVNFFLRLFYFTSIALGIVYERIFGRLRKS